MRSRSRRSSPARRRASGRSRWPWRWRRWRFRSCPPTPTRARRWTRGCCWSSPSACSRATCRTATSRASTARRTPTCSPASTRLTEPDVVIERGVGLLYRLAIIAGVFALAAPGGVVIAIAAALIAGALMFTLGLAAFAYFGGLAAAVAGLFLLSRAVTSPRAQRAALRARRHRVGARDRLSAAVRSRAWCWRAVPLLIGHPWSGVRRYLIGAAVGVLPLAVHMRARGAAAGVPEPRRRRALPQRPRSRRGRSRPTFPRRRG